MHGLPTLDRVERMTKECQLLKTGLRQVVKAVIYALNLLDSVVAVPNE